MPTNYLRRLGYNATGLGDREFDGGSLIFDHFLPELNSPASSDYFVVPPLSLNLNVSTGNFLRTECFRIGGMDVCIGAVINTQRPSLSHLPAGATIYTPGNTSAAITQRLASKKIVILLAKHSTLEETRSFVDSYGLSVFIDIIITSNLGESMSGSMGCPPGIRCDHPYPLNLTNAEGNSYLYAMAPPLGIGLGVLNLTFDNNGVLTHYAGDSILLNRSVHLPDPLAEKDIYDRMQVVTQQTGKVISSLPKRLIGDGSIAGPCRYKQCSFGSVVADALQNYSGADFAFVSGNMLHGNLSAGDLTYGIISSVFPLPTTLATFKVQGDILLAMLNVPLSTIDTTTESGGHFPQISGARVVYDLELPAAARVVSMQIYNPTSKQYENLDTSKMYLVATSDSNLAGADGFSALLPANAIDARPFGPALIDIIYNWIDGMYLANDYLASLDNPRVMLPLPPSAPVASRCLGSPPSPQFLCNETSGVYYSASSVSSNSTLIISSPTVVHGSLTLGTGLIIEGLSSTITITDCLSYNESIELAVVIAPKDIRQLKVGSKTYNLLSYRERCYGSSNASINIDIRRNDVSKCHKMSARTSIDDSTLAVVFTLNSGSCNTWIILVAVLGGVGLILITLALIVTFHQGARECILPFTKQRRRKYAQG